MGLIPFQECGCSLTIMIKLKIRFEVPFYLDKDEVELIDTKKIIDKVKRNINGWQYSSATVGIGGIVKVKWQEVPAGANRIYKEDIK